MRERTSDEFKEAVLQRMVDSPLSMRQFCIEEGIAQATLHKWKVRFNVSTECRTIHRSSDRWTSQEKFTAVLECATLSEVELSEYCRRKGLCAEQFFNRMANHEHGSKNPILKLSAKTQGNQNLTSTFDLTGFNEIAKQKFGDVCLR